MRGVHVQLELAFSVDASASTSARQPCKLLPCRILSRSASTAVSSLFHDHDLDFGSNAKFLHHLHERSVGRVACVDEETRHVATQIHGTVNLTPQTQQTRKKHTHTHTHTTRLVRSYLIAGTLFFAQTGLCVAWVTCSSLYTTPVEELIT